MQLSESNTNKERKGLEMLVFSLQSEEYAVKLTDIQEIVKTAEVTPVPNAPAAVVGVLNLRGTVVTMIDLSALFGLQNNSGELKDHTIIAEKDGELYGLLVHNAEEVLRIHEEELQSTPDLLQSHAHAQFLSGVIVTDTHAQKKEEEKEQESEEGNDKGAPEKSRVILSLDIHKILETVSPHSVSVDSTNEKESVDAPPAT